MSDECVIVRRLGMQGRREELTAMNAWLESFVAASSLPSAAAYHLDLVLNEAVTNVIDYAGELAGELHIDIACALQGDIVTLEITDNGRAFDPTAWREAPPPASLDEARPGGLGIHLMRKFTSSMAYQRNGGRNVLTMTIPLAAKPASGQSATHPA